MTDRPFASENNGSPVPHGTTRRAILGSATALVLGTVLPLGSGARVAAADLDPAVDPNAFVRIGEDGIVTVIVKHIEVGQGPDTGLAVLVAEELDADWSQVRAESAPANKALYANLLMGVQLTGGSTAMANSWLQMRRVGAAARAMLVQAAATQWGVDAAGIEISAGTISHRSSGRSGRFGDFARHAARLSPPSQVTLKRPDQFRLIGRDGMAKRLDSAAKATGRQLYGIDIREPDMLTVVLARPPAFGATLLSCDSREAEQVRGFKAVRILPSGVAIYATGMWSALKARGKLRLEWDLANAERRSSEDMFEHHMATSMTPGWMAAEHGDLAQAFARGETLERCYRFPFLAHAPMEPLNGYLDWRDGRATARYGSQSPTRDHAAIAEILGLDIGDVRLEVMRAGGSFGRRAQHDGHFPRELAAAAKAWGAPVRLKLVWTREDDIRGGYYRPMMVHRMRGAIRDGRLVGWHDTLSGTGFGFGTAFERIAIRNGVDISMVEGAAEIPYALPAFRCDVHWDKTGVPMLPWRSVGNSHSCYAVECFVDELLERAGKDPIAGRLELLGHHPRTQVVLRAVAKMAGWRGRRIGDRGFGVALSECFGSHVAQIAEVALDADGAAAVRTVWCAVDCGTPVTPDVIRAQIEGGIGFGLGHALHAEVPLDDGVPAVSNFHDYRSLRIDEMPAVHVGIIASTEPPSGIGEVAVPPIAPAVANALAALGRARPDRLPMHRPQPA
ncbi:xanthine dehydrogenase family protein molybdopterin-binding subunit [Sphingomonas sp. C8-2]|nr:xanthine dehydrogenase family protein molybdopterin-binding subunit [Sphingomonas sp. C8-2]